VLKGSGGGRRFHSRGAGDEGIHQRWWTRRSYSGIRGRFQWDGEEGDLWPPSAGPRPASSFFRILIGVQQARWRCFRTAFTQTLFLRERIIIGLSSVRAPPVQSCKVRSFTTKTDVTRALLGGRGPTGCITLRDLTGPICGLFQIPACC